MKKVVTHKDDHYIQNKPNMMKIYYEIFNLTVFLITSTFSTGSSTS